MKLPFEARGLLGPGLALVVGLPPLFRLQDEIEAADSIKLATAFAHWLGWNHLLPHINKSQGTVKLLTGLSFCQTEPDVLYDWHERSCDGRAEARLFTDKRTTFHPKVLLVKAGPKAFVVVGSGNLSNGGFLTNIECGLFSDDAKVFGALDDWFESLFSNDDLTKQLGEPDIRRYKKRFDAAKKPKKEIEHLQHAAEEEIGDQHRAGLNNWQKAVDLAKAFFKSKRFANLYSAERSHTAKEIKDALPYPRFDFDKDGLEAFYKIQALGHLIEIRKPQVWKQKSTLQAGLRLLVDNSKPIEARLEAVLNGRYRVDGIGLTFLTKVLAAHDPSKFTVWNDVIRQAFGDFGYEHSRGLSKARSTSNLRSL